VDRIQGDFVFIEVKNEFFNKKDYFLKSETKAIKIRKMIFDK